MKKWILTALVTFSVMGAYAQKTTVKIKDTQARLLDVSSNAYVKPLVVELEVINTDKPDKGRIVDEWVLSKDEVEGMNGDLTNIRSWGVYMSSKKHNVDVIVAATFNFENDENNPGFYKLTVIGYPAIFKNWETAKATDYEWIRMEKTITTADREKISAIVK